MATKDSVSKYLLSKNIFGGDNEEDLRPTRTKRNPSSRNSVSTIRKACKSVEEIRVLLDGFSKLVRTLAKVVFGLCLLKLAIVLLAHPLNGAVPMSFNQITSAIRLLSRM